MTVRAGEKDEPRRFDGARMPRDTRKRRIRAGEHKIRRMDLKGFERIVARVPPLAKISLSLFPPIFLPKSVFLADSVDIVRVSNRTQVSSKRRQKKDGEERNAFSRKQLGCAGKTVFFAG